ncbi:hypothetical protein [Chitinophaga sp.]|uniref:hypothetical protein n=1 Tax=Chitinophaga sp. TaxID=1869181 RepID=UPI0031DC0C0D
MSFLKKLFGSKSDPQSWREITKSLAHAISTSLNTATEIEWGSEPAQTRITCKSPGGSTMTTFAGNLVVRCQAQPENMQEIFEAHIETLAEDMRMIDSGQTVTLTDVLPMIKSLEWLDVARKQMQATGLTGEQLEKRFIHRPLQGELIVVYVADSEHGMAYLSHSQVAEIGLADGEELHQTALNNLRRKLGDITYEGGGGRYAVRLDNNYDASLALLIEDILPNIEINGRPVMAIPSRDELLICGDQDAESVQSLRDVAGKIFAVNPYTISKQLYAWRDGAIVLLK